VSRTRERGILALVPDDWDVAWQRRHQVLSRLRHEAPVAWISPPRPRGHAVKPFRAEPPAGMMIVEDDGFRLFGDDRKRARRRAEKGAEWLRVSGCTSIELQVWLPEFADALDWNLHTTTSYHVDDEYSWSTVDGAMSDRERRLIERVDRVFVTSPKLLETKGGINPHTIFSPNGVDVHAYAAPTAEPQDVARIPHPRIGYVGVLKQQLDWDLITTLVTRHPAWSFVFVGPVRTVHATVPPIVARLERLPNVFLLGERSQAELPAYMQHIDVSLLPYQRNDYTNAINPLKLYESLAAGTPVVSARIRTVEEFGPVVAIADTADDWSNALSAALADADRAAERRESVAGYDWDIIARGLL
jgi:glycosyltransferase involved in cell wall biosynthesis